MTALFYGRGFERLREHRSRQMKGALRKAGISFYPEEWPTAETRIQLSREGGFIDHNGVDPALEALLPQWRSLSCFLPAHAIRSACRRLPKGW